jgi:hypothetical protein
MSLGMVIFSHYSRTLATNSKKYGYLPHSAPKSDVNQVAIFQVGRGGTCLCGESIFRYYYFDR